jgi:hypothetical protein
MIEFRGKLILLDIEGTVSPLAFVHDVMFPYARQHAAAWLGAHWGHEVIAQLARDAGVPPFSIRSMPRPPCIASWMPMPKSPA